MVFEVFPGVLRGGPGETQCCLIDSLNRVYSKEAPPGPPTSGPCTDHVAVFGGGGGSTMVGLHRLFCFVGGAFDFLGLQLFVVVFLLSFNIYMFLFCFLCVVL